jgi:long-subunit fatty acid transport protein
MMRQGCRLVQFLGFGAVLWVGLVVLGQAAWSDDFEDYIVQSRLDRYYDLPQTARVLGMGGASLVTSSDISSVFGNPAGLGFVKRPEVGLNYSNEWADGDEIIPFFGTTPGNKALPDGTPHRVRKNKNQGGLQLVLPCYAKGVFGLGAWFDDTDYSDYKNSDAERWRLNAGYGYAVNDCFSFGYSLTYFHDKADDDFTDYKLDDGFRHTFGLQLRPNQCSAFGASAYFAEGHPQTRIRRVEDPNTPGPFPDNDTGDLDSWGVEFGYSWQVLERTLLAASVDYQEHSFDGTAYAPDQDEVRRTNEDIKGWGFHAGVEQNYFNCMLARLGYRYQTNEYTNSTRGQFFQGRDDFDSNYHAISGGFGWNFSPCLTLDYGVEYRFVGSGDLNNTITARFHF